MSQPHTDGGRAQVNKKGEVIAAFAASHAPGIRAWPKAAEAERFRVFEETWGRMRARVEALKPEAIVLVTSEHWVNFSLACMPAFCIGVAPEHQGPAEEWLKVEKKMVPGLPSLAEAIVRQAMDDGVDLAYSHELELDHGAVVPLSYLTPHYDVPVVPIIQNCLAPPLPPMRRSWALGESVRRAVEASGKRVLVIGAGGLSHWPGELRHGEIDSELDKRLLEIVAAGDGERLSRLTDADIANGGSGLAEIRNWVTALATVPARPFDVLFYEPFKGFATGCALAMTT